MTAQAQANVTQKSNLCFYLAVGIVCAAVMALQILQSRIFSVVTWYHLSFLTISIAMFGLTLGALDVYRGNREDQRLRLGTMLGESSLKFGLLSVVTLFVQMHVPIVDQSFQSIFFTLPLVAGFSAATYYQAGKIVSLCLTRSGLPVGKVYAADMIGASLGCLVAIWLMQTMDAPSAVLLTAGAIIANGFMFGSTPGTIKNRAIMVALSVVLVAGGIANASMKERLIYPRWTKTTNLTRDKISFEEWNAISRITVSPNLGSIKTYLWGASPNLPEGVETDYQYLRVDGAAGTPIMKFDGENWDAMSYLEYDLTNLVHFIPKIESFAIVGVGGGRDLLSALYFKAKRVVALDINNIQVKLLKEIPEYRSYSNLWSQPGVDIVNSEARSWFTHSKEKFDAIQMSMIDTWVSSAAGAFALTENSLYTVEAWKVFLSRLNDNGVFTVSRWHAEGAGCNDLCRLATITSTALMQMGKTDPHKHVFIAYVGQGDPETLRQTGQGIVTFIVGRDPLTEAQVDSLHAAADKFGYHVMTSPRMPAENEYLDKILKAKTLAEVDKTVADLPFDVSASTDNRPFFFNQARIWKPWEVIKQASEGNMYVQNMRGHAIATVNLYVIFVFSVLASVLVLVLPFRKAVAFAPKAFIRAGTLYFGLIGLGFMFVEITLMQMMSMFLGHPVYGLGVVLFSMILSSGIGSYLSEMAPLNSRARLVAWSMILMVYVGLMAISIGTLMEALIETSFETRVALCIGMIFPAGMLMGFAFPTGMRLTEKVSDALTPWFWGINGALGVVASVMALFISISLGLPFTILAGALCYGALVFPALSLEAQSRR